MVNTNIFVYLKNPESKMIKEREDAFVFSIEPNPTLLISFVFWAHTANINIEILEVNSWFIMVSNDF